MKNLFNLVISLLLPALVFAASSKNIVPIPYTDAKPTIDGQIQPSEWDAAQWADLNKDIIGGLPSQDDFSGRYKLMWDESALYLLAEIQDDVLFDQHADPLYFYWDDDCLEIFVDEDASGGDHQYNYNAFAYHVALDNQAVDIGTQLSNGEPEFLLFNDHIESRWQRQQSSPNKVFWEVAITLHDDTFSPNKDDSASRVKLQNGKNIGFMLAYCDNDRSKHREHFIGSHEIQPIDGDKNLGYKTADVFGRYKLVK